jgi:hypothetical protein
MCAGSLEAAPAAPGSTQYHRGSTPPGWSGRAEISANGSNSRR